MRHHNHNRKLGREKDQREALLRSLAVALIKEEKIKTTEAKAKELRPYAEKLVTAAKRDTIASRRMLLGEVGKGGSTKLVKEVAPRYKDRAGGYTRILKMPRRKNDGSKMAVIEFV